MATWYIDECMDNVDGHRVGYKCFGGVADADIEDVKAEAALEAEALRDGYDEVYVHLVDLDTLIHYNLSKDGEWRGSAPGWHAGPGGERLMALMRKIQPDYNREIIAANSKIGSVVGPEDAKLIADRIHGLLAVEWEVAVRYGRYAPKYSHGEVLDAVLMLMFGEVEW